MSKVDRLDQAQRELLRNLTVEPSSVTRISLL
jgi:hypothetical protein